MMYTIVYNARYIWASSYVYMIYPLMTNTDNNYLYAIKTTPNTKTDKTYSYNNKNTNNNDNNINYSNYNVLYGYRSVTPKVKC